MRRDLLVVIVLAALAVAWLVQRSSAPVSRATPLDTTALLADAPEAFARVIGPEALEFPADHAAHPGYRSEWWYFTGNLTAEDGRRFGMQFTLFRFGLSADEQARPLDSVFAADAVWMAHLAVSDIEAGRFLHRERFARGTLDLAGATADEWWLRDWVVKRTETGWRLQADAGEFGVDLALDAVKPVVLQGDAGYSRKGPEPGNASRYYTLPRLAAHGSVSVANTTHSVDGTAWLDREWGSSQLGAGIEGWDWFALQLNDGRDLMLYRLRTEDGTASPYSAGALIGPGGQARMLDLEAFSLEPVRTWRDTEGASWPVAWRVRVPSANLDLLVRAAFDEQQWRTGVRYWEGAVDIVDPESSQLQGYGYLELSGYARSAGGRVR